MQVKSEMMLQLEKILSSQELIPWEYLNSIWQQKIIRSIAPGTTPDLLAYPRTQEELTNIIACAHDRNWGILPCGSGSKLDWGGLVKGINIVVSTERLNRLIEHAVGDLTVTVEAGMKFAELQRILAQKGQFLPLDPAAPEIATIGGIVATSDTGSLRQRYGGVRDMLLGLSLVRADGKLTKAGGRVVKNVAGYDLMKLFTGCFGTLGIISQVTFRVYPIPPASETVILIGTEEAIAKVTKTLLSSALTPIAVDLLSKQLVDSLGLGKGMGLIVRFQSLTTSVKEQAARLQSVGEKLGSQGSSYSGDDEVKLWQELQERIRKPHTSTTIICKIGVLPTNAVAIINRTEIGLIHAGSGLGILQFDGINAAETLQKMRSLCQSQGGFLTILSAPVALKQELDVWGYTGNAIDLMHKIKQQFDPKNILSPHRFVGGI